MMSAPLAVSIAASLLYFLSIPWQPFPGVVVLKGLSIAPLAILAWQKTHPLLAAALALSSLGDVLLEISPEMFAFGLGSFLCAHIVYTTMFLRKRTSFPEVTQVVIMLGVAAYGVLFAVWLTPHLGKLGAPVWAYMAAITAMAVTSIASGLRPAWVITGALLFLISDSILAANKFVGPVPLRGWLVWSTYVLGQYGLCLGVLSASRHKSASGSPWQPQRGHFDLSS